MAFPSLSPPFSLILIKGKLFIVFTDHMKEEEEGKSVSEWEEKSSSLFGQLKSFFLFFFAFNFTILNEEKIAFAALQLNVKRVR